MNWYKTLNINQRIWLKSNTESIVGIDWENLKYFFGFKYTIEILYNKLKIEGFKV